MIDTNALRKKVLDLAIRGKLVPQNPNDEPASVLLERIREEKQRLIREGKIKKDKADSIIFRGEDNCHYEKVGNKEPVLLEDLPFDLPNGWAWARLPSIADVSAGGTPNRGVKKFWENGNIPWLKISDITSVKKYVNKAEEYITEDGLNNSSAQYYEKGTILYTIFATVGEVGILDFRATCNQAIAGIKCFDTNFLDYLYYYLKNLKDFMISQSKGNAQVNINQSKLKAALIAVPPISEQKRIVKYIQEIFDVIELLENNQNDYTELVESLKKAILQSAIQGTLVEQCEDDEPASALLERIREEKRKQLGKKYVESYIYKGSDNRYYEHINEKSVDISENIPFELPRNWCWARWGDISESIQYGYNAPAKENGRIKMVRISDIQNGKVVWGSVPYCDIDEEDIKNYTLKAGDILFARTGGTVGKSYLVTEVPEEAIYAGYLIRTRYSNQLSSQYLKYFMETNLYWLQLTNGTTATAQPNCNGKTLGKMLLPIPPLAEQERIVSKINEIFAQL